ncbi:MAG: hypothetical protein [Podoviridae sp. ctQNx1]|nr:MAG: hypothetical protein [Podoviridae sp. ctQNx1]UOF78118.1 hypothetical protein [Caudoviricetes sp.]
MGEQQQGKKNRKLGRNAKRPSQVRYVVENHLERNKRRRMAAAEKKRVADANKVMKTPRGTARRHMREANAAIQAARG